QAEDGIRDFHVTGVQTCALPIYRRRCAARSARARPLGLHDSCRARRGPRIRRVRAARAGRLRRSARALRRRPRRRRVCGMRRRSWDHLAAGISLVLLAGLAAGTGYLALVADRQDVRTSARTPPGEPDYFRDDAVFTRININGDPVYRMSAEHLLHFPEDG